MRNVFTICGREVKSYFTSPVAYILMGLFGLLTGFMFYSATAYFYQAGMQQQMSGQGGSLSINDYVIAPLLGNLGVISLFLIPLIAMRLFAEEKRSGTIELLLTSPVSDWDIIMGKFLGAMVMYLSIIGFIALNIGLLFAWSTPDWRPVLTGLLGLILQAPPFSRSARSSPPQRKTRSVRAPAPSPPVCCFGCFPGSVITVIHGTARPSRTAPSWFTSSHFRKASSIPKT